MRVPLVIVCAYSFLTLTATTVSADITVYSQNFDVDDSANWTINDGPSDEEADFYFDYSTMGIPSAPNAGGTTRGMKLAANLYSSLPAANGFSVSPTGQSFTGDYTLSFDLWSNYLGHRTDGVGVGATGSTMLSTYGIMSSGTFANYPGSADGLFFANTGDGGSGADYRAYSVERNISYQVPPITDPFSPDYSPADLHATHHAGDRNHTATLYTDNFGGATVPAAQTTLYPDTQHGTTPLGSMGFEWHHVEIVKSGATVTWLVDGIALITVETADFLSPVGGSNILFGHSDTNGTGSIDLNYEFTSFTLIDNVVVTVVPEPAISGLVLVSGALLTRRRRG